MEEDDGSSADKFDKTVFPSDACFQWHQLTVCTTWNNDLIQFPSGARFRRYWPEACATWTTILLRLLAKLPRYLIWHFLL